ncbi:MAG TPA: class II aldolase/adducin family protein [Anaerolineaceae bacterium]|nr:class II aldolase/adducin family protein [Anaerolineaceae bacterium]
MLKELRQAVLECARQMVADGFAYESQGNLSALDRESGLIVITPSALPYKEMRWEDICVIDPAGKPIAGRWKPTSEMPMHTILYRERPDVAAVVHSHAPHASVFAVIDEPIPLILAEAALCLTGPVPVAPYLRPGTEALARSVLETLAGGAAVLLGSHGLLTVGASLEQAYAATVAAEVAARLTILARSMGASVRPIDEQECQSLRALYLAGYAPKAVNGER